ncbi:hypothetical protein T492DRAFT_861425 [Pavlovales sp. CCMP2436]|nr:hypothetical protein T492DRAFT_861425 [Pavlovales sp. CCMP2436]
MAGGVSAPMAGGVSAPLLPVALMLPCAMAGDMLSPQMPIALCAMASGVTAPLMSFALQLPCAMAGDMLSAARPLAGLLHLAWSTHARLAEHPVDERAAPETPEVPWTLAPPPGFRNFEQAACRLEQAKEQGVFDDCSPDRMMRKSPDRIDTSKGYEPGNWLPKAAELYKTAACADDEP